MKYSVFNIHSVFHFIIVKPIKDHDDKSTEILAAVSAGMVPATIAMLMPIVLGRKRRSIVIHFQRKH